MLIAVTLWMCIRIFSKHSHYLQVDTVTYYSTIIPMPKLILEAHLHQAGSGIVSMLTNPSPSPVIQLQSGNPIQNA